MAYQPIQELACHGVPVSEGSYEPALPENLAPGRQGARYVTTATDPQKSHRWMVTMVNRWTGAEELLDLACEGGSFTDMVHEVRRHFNYDWEIFEWFDPDVPF